MKLGSLFSGFGGLDIAIENVFGAETVWVSDIEPGPCKVLAHRWPGIPNLGDITTVDWSTVEPVDIIAGGTPCQDISSAGRMAGMREGTRSNLWVEMREAIRTLRPTYVIWENVSAARSTTAASAMESDPRLLGGHPAGVPVLRTLGRVLGDLASLGYDAQWYSLRAADVGAPHGRLRYFVLAANTANLGYEWRGGARERRAGLADGCGDPVMLLPTPRATDGTKGGPNQRGSSGDLMLPSAVAMLPTPRDTRGGSTTEISYALGGEQAWGPYLPAIRRWEAINGPAPAPTKLGRTGRPKLNPAFAEWMMGAPAGWITDVPGVTDNEALRMAGNGVVHQQAEAALRIMLDRFLALWVAA